MLQAMKRSAEVLHLGPHRLAAPEWQPVVDVSEQADGLVLLRTRVLTAGATAATALVGAGSAIDAIDVAVERTGLVLRPVP